MMIKRMLPFMVAILLSLACSVSHAQRKASRKQVAGKIPIELVEQIIGKNGARDWVNDQYQGSPAKFSEAWETQQVALRKNKTTLFIIRALDTFFSGSGTGTLFVYERTAEGYRGLAALGISNGASVTVGSTFTNGYPDLYERVKGKPSSKISFDGRSYDFKR